MLIIRNVLKNKSPEAARNAFLKRFADYAHRSETLSPPRDGEAGVKQ